MSDPSDRLHRMHGSCRRYFAVGFADSVLNLICGVLGRDRTGANMAQDSPATLGAEIKRQIRLPRTSRIRGNTP